MECCYPVQCGPPAPVYIPPIQTCSMSCYQEPPLRPLSLPPPPVIFNYCVEKPPPIPRHHEHYFHPPSPQRVHEDCCHPPPPTCYHEDCGNKPPRPYYHNYGHPPNPYIQEDCYYHPKDSYQISKDLHNLKPSHKTSKHQNDLHSEYGCDPVSVNCCQPDPKRLCAPPHCTDQDKSKEQRQPEEPHYHWEPRQKNCCTQPTKPLPAVTTQNECDSPCKHIKTKYIIPCYRYEDGRINQPSEFMSRACEVACGWQHKKPYVESSYAADPNSEVRRYHSEDEQGNFCFHFEKKKQPKKCVPCVPVYPSLECLPRPCPPPNRLPHPPSKPELPFEPSTPCPPSKLKSCFHPCNEKYTEFLYA